MENPNSIRLQELSEESISIKGMHCKSCADTIEAKVKALKGIETIKVSLVENKAFIRFHPQKINLDKIKSEINSLGYFTDNDKKINERKKNRGFLQGLVYGLVPHIGCMAFIISSVLGVTVATEFFKPLLMNPYFFHILFLLSFVFATISSAIYLRKNGLLSLAGIKRKKKYLLTMYGSTTGINLLLFMVIFPLLANVTPPSITGAAIGIGTDLYSTNLSSITLQVDIPCPGHAPLISGELRTIKGVQGVQFSFPNIFDVKYDSTKTSKQKILSLDVFNTYKATVIDESSAISGSSALQTTNKSISRRTSCGCGGGCGGKGCCGG